MPNNSVTVVIPHLGPTTYITDAVDSILAQTILPEEVIIVFDGPTAFEGMEYLELTNIDFVFCCSLRRGLSVVRNLGIQLAKSEWIAFLDSDDLWHHKKLEAQKIYFARSTSLIHGNAYIFNQEKPNEFRLITPQIDFSYGALLLGDYVLSGSSSSVVARRNILLKEGGFDENILKGEDWDMWLRLSKIGELKHTPLAISFIRIHQNNMQMDNFTNLSFDKRNFSFFGVVQIVVKHCNFTDKKLLLGIREMLLQRLEWQIILLAKNPYLALYVLPRYLKMDFPEIWSLLFPSPFSFIRFVFRLVNSRRTNILKKLALNVMIRIRLG